MMIDKHGAALGAEELLAARSGDVRATARLLGRHLRTMHGVARRLCASPVDAEDAVQEACLLALTRLHQVRGPEALRPWLHAVVANAARMQRRRQRCRPQVLAAEPQLDELRDDAALPEERCHQRRRLEALRALWPSIAVEQRAALELREVQGLSFAETAQRLRTTPKAVKTRVCRARAQLRAALG